MSPQYFTYASHGKVMSDTFGYSQAVSIHSASTLIFASGQGGWDAQGTMVTPYPDQVKQAFDNVEAALAAAGAKLTDVIKVESFHVGKCDGDALAPMVENMKTRVQNRPTWTAVSVPELSMPGMLVEIQVTAVAS